MKKTRKRGLMSSSLDDKSFIMRDTDLSNSRYPVTEPMSEQAMIAAWNDIDKMKQRAKAKRLEEITVTDDNYQELKELFMEGSINSDADYIDGVEYYHRLLEQQEERDGDILDDYPSSRQSK